MYEFNYHKALSVENAVETIENSDDGKFLAGGMTLLPTMKQKLAAPDVLVDLGGLQSMTGIHKKDNTIIIGAMVPHVAVERSPLINAHLPGLAQLASVIGDPQVRNRGTLGGSVANADPAADYPAAVLALGATIVTNQRSIHADDFFVDLFETALEEHEVIVQISFPIVSNSGYKKFPNPASHYPIVGVFIARAPDATQVAVTGAAGCVFRHHEMEQRLRKSFTANALDGLTIESTDFNEDIHANAEYRAHLINVIAKRLLASMD